MKCGVKILKRYVMHTGGITSFVKKHIMQVDGVDNI